MSDKRWRLFKKIDFKWRIWGAALVIGLGEDNEWGVYGVIGPLVFMFGIERGDL